MILWQEIRRKVQRVIRILWQERKGKVQRDIIILLQERMKKVHRGVIIFYRRGREVHKKLLDKRDGDEILQLFHRGGKDRFKGMW
jgi:hypothetical protein